MPKKSKAVTPIQIFQGEEGFIVEPVKFYAERTQILVKKSVTEEDTSEYYLTLHTDNPEVLKVGVQILEVTIKPAE